MAAVIDDLQRSVDGESWHGPAIRDILEGVTAADAAAHPVPGAHSIWELLQHVNAWVRAVHTRVQGTACELEGESDWPPVRDTSERAWTAAFDELRRSLAELVATLKRIGDAGLDAPVPNRKYDGAHLLHGLAQHNAYHAGQMSLLKRALQRSGSAGQRSG
jgi:uncharacterized damage-inducible protein DinB